LFPTDLPVKEALLVARCRRELIVEATGKCIRVERYAYLEYPKTPFNKPRFYLISTYAPENVPRYRSKN
jgi:hypothetical protein